MRKLLLVLFFAAQSFGALNLMTWDGSASNDFNDTANWTGTISSGSTLSAGDSCLFATGSTAATVSDNVEIGALIVSGYTGTISLQTYTLTVSGTAINLGGATLSAGTSTLALTGAAAQSVTSAGESWYDININRNTAGTLTFPDTLFAHSVSASATNTQIITFSAGWYATGDITLSGSSAINITGRCKFAGASSAYTMANTIGTVTITSGILHYTGTTAPTWVQTKNMGTTVLFTKCQLDTLAKLTASGTPASWTYRCVGGNTLTINGGGTMYLAGSANDTIFNFGPNVTFNGTTLSAWRPTGTTTTFYLKNVNYTGTGQLLMGPNGSTPAASVKLLSDMTFTGPYLQWWSGNSVGQYFDCNGFNLTCKSLDISAIGTDTSEFYLRNGTVSCTSLVNAYTTVLSFQCSTGTFKCSKNLTLRSNWVFNPGTSRFIFDGTGAATWTMNGKHFAWFTDSGSAASKLTLADSLYGDSAITLHSGKFDQNGKTMYCRDYFRYSPDSVYMSADLNVTRNFYRDALGTITKRTAGQINMTGSSATMTMSALTFGPIFYNPSTNGKLSMLGGATVDSLTMRSAGGDTIQFETLKKWTFSKKLNVRGAAGSRNHFVCSNVNGKDTIDLVAKDTLRNFYIRNQYFVDTVYCKRSDSCFSGGGNF